MANVQDFGAAGDGNTDDTEAIRHAISEGDGVLEFNKGTYRITRPLVLDLTRQGFGGIRELSEAKTTSYKTTLLAVPGGEQLRCQQSPLSCKRM